MVNKECPVYKYAISKYGVSTKNRANGMYYGFH